MADDDKKPTAAEAKQAAAANQRDPVRNPPASYRPTRADPIDDDDRDKTRAEELREEIKDRTEALVDKQAAKEKADREYAVLVAETQMRNAELLRLVGQPSKKPTTIVEYSAQAKKNGDPMVNAIIPKRFNHRLDDHTLIDVLPGVRQIPAALANHWWFKANEVVAQD